MESSPPSPASSPLSDPGSDQFEDSEYYRPEMGESTQPAAKRQRVGESSLRATPVGQEFESAAFSTISSDTDGEVPQSPGASRAEDDEPVHEQVTVCAWDGCDEGEFGNMDKLVEHIHNDHIEGRQKKYTCEWEDCSRKSMPHASGYALRAHMRSHTREKPFYCALPECDRAFTRSDALAKHMRTVHETEALRPSDPIPKSMQPLLKNGGRLKLIIKQPHEHSETNGQSPGPGVSANSNSNGTHNPSHPDSDLLTPFPADMFTSEELAVGSKELFHLLKRQLHWAEEDAELIKAECEMVEALRQKEFTDKEILLGQVIKNELDWHERRQLVLATLAPSAAELRGQELRAMAKSQMDGGTDMPSGPDSQTETGKSEQGGQDQRDAAAVLASLSRG